MFNLHIAVCIGPYFDAILHHLLAVLPR